MAVAEKTLAEARAELEQSVRDGSVRAEEIGMLGRSYGETLDEMGTVRVELERYARERGWRIVGPKFE